MDILNDILKQTEECDPFSFRKKILCINSSNKIFKIHGEDSNMIFHL